jgi:hypothetical protein
VGVVFPARAVIFTGDLSLDSKSTPTFTLDEDALPIGADILAEAATRLLTAAKTDR